MDLETSMDGSFRGLFYEDKTALLPKMLFDEYLCSKAFLMPYVTIRLCLFQILTNSIFLIFFLSQLFNKVM